MTTSRTTRTLGALLVGTICGLLVLAPAFLGPDTPATATVHAQGSPGTIQTVDLGSLGWGLLSHPKSVEIDGNPLTQEWVVSQPFTANHRLIFADATGLNIRCTGEWFDLSGGWVWQRTAGPNGVLLHRLTRHVGSQFSVWTLPVAC